MTKLFVYGSLRKGCFNHHYLEGIAEYKGLFYVKGDNFTLTNQKYPALILSDQNTEGKPEDFTIGELYELSDKSLDLDKVFKDMDEMEGYYGENVEKNHYDRLLLDIYDSDYKKADKAYVYGFNLINTELKDTLGEKIKDNDFLNFYTPQK